MAWSTLRDLVCVSNYKTRVCQKAFLRSSLVGLGRNSSSLSFPLSFITPDRSVEFWWNWSRKWRMRSFFKGGYNLYVIAFTLQEETGNLLEITVLPNPVRKLLRNYALSSYFTKKRYQIAVHDLLYISLLSYVKLKREITHTNTEFLISCSNGVWKYFSMLEKQSKIVIIFLSTKSFHKT